ncbi:MAG: isocitrate/isopropylmalate dehydrogenase family protein [Lacunisphaera sp.]|nr:isocitrate/isopropylmalate dehydrogenase family protein [Lacunisphaera sp.]
MRIGILKGNGIGPEIIAATQQVLSATGRTFEWVDIPIANEAIALHGHPLPQQTVDALKAVGVAIKGPLIVDKLQGRLTCIHRDGTEHTYPSLNNAIRRELALFVNPRPIRGMGTISGRHNSLDMVIMREITEDVYIGWEHQIGDIAAEAIKLTTRIAAERVARFSFEFARKNGRRRVTCVHKANVLNYTDGLFLRCCRKVALEFPDIAFDDCMIDAACYHVVKDPARFDVICTSNQYGDIFSDLGAGLIGSLGLAPGANIGADVAVFEASHGAAPDIAGQGIANPIALILSGALLLRHVGLAEDALRVEKAVRHIVITGCMLTPDLGGISTTQQITDAICAEIISTS